MTNRTSFHGVGEDAGLQATQLEQSLAVQHVRFEHFRRERVVHLCAEK